MNPDNGLCDGCLRTLDEIAEWSALDEDGKRLVWQRIADRRQCMPAAEPPASPGDPR